MAFTMNNVQKKCATKKDKIVECTRLIYQNDLLTDNIKYALIQYSKYRFQKRLNSNFTAKKLQELIDDLLVYIFEKDVNTINFIDVYNSENEIIYEIAKAIAYGAVHHLYYKPNDVININTENLRKNLIEPKRLPDNVKLKQMELENYFKEIMV